MTSPTVNLTPELYQYMLSVSLREPPLLAELRAETAALEGAGMQISPDQGQFLAFLIKLTGAKRLLEIGVFTGYSATVAALALPRDGQLIACDVNAEWTAVARRYWQKAGVAGQIELHLAPAVDTLINFLDEGQQNSFDMAFIDADKTNYGRYYELCLQLVRPGGLIVIDNVLWDGRVIDPEQQDPDTVAIRSLNQKLHPDQRVELSLVPIGDGMTLLQKRP